MKLGNASTALPSMIPGTVGTALASDARPARLTRKPAQMMASGLLFYWSGLFRVTLTYEFDVGKFTFYLYKMPHNVTGYHKYLCYHRAQESFKRYAP